MEQTQQTLNAATAHQQAQQRLKAAAEAGDINGLYNSIQEDPHVLDRIDAIPFVETPLHTAASAGHTHFALEIINLKPSFGRKLNPQGLTPLDLALRNEKSETVTRLINFDKELIRVKGRERLTPLHYLAETNKIHILAEFLLACPASIMDLTIRDETALHIAVKNFKLEAFKVLLGMLRKTYRQEMLNWKNDEGNTVLHIAVSTSQLETVKLLVKYMNKNAKNLEGLTALDMVASLGLDDDARREIENTLGVAKSSPLVNDCSPAEFLMSPQQFLEAMVGFGRRLHSKSYMSVEMRNAILVVAVLIATASFQAILQPPGGIMSGSRNNYYYQQLLPTNGTHDINATTNLVPTNITSYFNVTSIPDKTYENFFPDFYALNTVCFIASITVIMLVLPFQPYTVLLHMSLIFLMLSYGESFLVISPSNSWALIFWSLSFGSAIFLYGMMLVNFGKIILKLQVLIIFMSRLRVKRLRMLLSLFEE